LFVFWSKSTIPKVARQGCSIFSALFDTYLDEAFRQLMNRINVRLKLTSNIVSDILEFAEHFTIITELTSCRGAL
jgi:hypothetical protein